MQVYGPLPPGGNPIPVNKHRIILLTVNHSTSGTTAVRELSGLRGFENEIIALLRCYAGWIANQLPRFRGKKILPIDPIFKGQAVHLIVQEMTI